MFAILKVVLRGFVTKRRQDAKRLFYYWKLKRGILLKALVTGAAGFIGSTLSERLLSLGYEVTGIDCFTDYYPESFKRSNVSRLIEQSGFTLIEKNLLDLDLVEVLDGVDYIFHHAAQPGVRASWGKYFEVYAENNVITTQRLLEVAKDQPIKKFVYASSSSVYGNTDDLPAREISRPGPISPYGVTKLAAEHLAVLYSINFNVPTVSLRYFTVYGPRQRPDMAFHRFIKAIIEGAPISVFGSGEQTRDFTFIADIVDANVGAMQNGADGAVYNIGGGSRVSVLDVISMLETILEKRAIINYMSEVKGDVKDTSADIAKAIQEIGYSPKYPLMQGLAEEVEWVKAYYSL